MSATKLKYEPLPDDAKLNEDLEFLAEVIDKHCPGLGKTVVIDIAKSFGGTHVAFPKAEHFHRTYRDGWIRAKYDDGFKVPEIARAVKLGERRVWDILGMAPGEDKQLSLF